MSRPEFIEENYPETDRPTIARALNRAEVYADEHGYKVTLWAGAIHPQHGWIAWVDYYEKRFHQPRYWVDCNYYLRIKYDEKTYVEWIIETYNPYFGCFIGYFSWHNNNLIIMYEEKHRVYGATLDKTGLVKRIELGSGGTEFCVRDTRAIIYPISNYKQELPCYKIPSWESLPPMSEDEAIKLGILRRQ